jgi:hypothetical protein
MSVHIYVIPQFTSMSQPRTINFCVCKVLQQTHCATAPFIRRKRILTKLQAPPETMSTALLGNKQMAHIIKSIQIEHLPYLRGRGIF